MAMARGVELAQVAVDLLSLHFSPFAEAPKELVVEEDPVPAANDAGEEVH